MDPTTPSEWITLNSRWEVIKEPCDNVTLWHIVTETGFLVAELSSAKVARQIARHHNATLPTA